jgi:hypothetical protein
MTEGVSAYEQKIDGFLERIEAQFSKVDDTLAFAKAGAENGAAARADAAVAARDAAACRKELSETNGAISDLQVGQTALAKEVAETRKELGEFRAEFKRGFAELWKHLLPDEPGDEAGVAIATVHPIRQPDPAE